MESAKAESVSYLEIFVDIGKVLCCQIGKHFSPPKNKNRDEEFFLEFRP
jgi:hypothetical protein